MGLEGKAQGGLLPGRRVLMGLGGAWGGSGRWREPRRWGWEEMGPTEGGRAAGGGAGDQEEADSLAKLPQEVRRDPEAPER